MTVIIKMKDGAVKVIENCSMYEIQADKNLAIVTVNGYNNFFNWNFVQYIGDIEAIENEEMGE